MEKTTDPWQLYALGIALKAAAGVLAPAEAQQAFTHLLSAMKKIPNLDQLGALANALKAAETLVPAEAQRAFTHLLFALEKATDIEQLGALANALKAVPGTLYAQQLINMLKWPVSVGVLRSTLLDMLEKQTGQKFDGDLWKMVPWAQANGLDVKSPPARPERR